MDWIDWMDGWWIDVPTWWWSRLWQRSQIGGLDEERCCSVDEDVEAWLSRPSSDKIELSIVAATLRIVSSSF